MVDLLGDLRLRVRRCRRPGEQLCRPPTITRRSVREAEEATQQRPLTAAVERVAEITVNAAVHREVTLDNGYGAAGDVGLRIDQPERGDGGGEAPVDSVDVQPLDEVTIVDAAVVDLVADVVDGRVDDRSPRAIHESGIRHRL